MVSTLEVVGGERGEFSFILNRGDGSLGEVEEFSFILARGDGALGEVEGELFLCKRGDGVLGEDATPLSLGEDLGDFDGLSSPSHLPFLGDNGGLIISLSFSSAELRVGALMAITTGGIELNTGMAGKGFFFLGASGTRRSISAGLQEGGEGVRSGGGGVRSGGGGVRSDGGGGVVLSKSIACSMS